MIKQVKKALLYTAGFVCYAIGSLATVLKRVADSMYWRIRRGFQNLEQQ